MGDDMLDKKGEATDRGERAKPMAVPTAGGRLGSGSGKKKSTA